MILNQEQAAKYGTMSAHPLEEQRETVQDKAMKQGVISAKNPDSMGSVIKSAIHHIREEGSDPTASAGQLIRDTISAVGTEQTMDLGVVSAPSHALEKPAAALEKSRKLMEIGTRSAQ